MLAYPTFLLQGLYFVLYTPKYFWIGPGIIILFAILTPLVLWLAHRNEFTRDVVKHGWTPVIAAMGISRYDGLVSVTTYFLQCWRVNFYSDVHNFLYIIIYNQCGCFAVLVDLFWILLCHKTLASLCFLQLSMVLEGIWWLYKPAGFQLTFTQVVIHLVACLRLTNLVVYLPGKPFCHQVHYDSLFLSCLHYPFFYLSFCDCLVLTLIMLLQYYSSNQFLIKM